MPTRRDLLGYAAAALGSLSVPGTAPARDAGRSPLVDTSHGPVRGFLDRDICVFRGVRYGADTRPRRFRPPARPPAWATPRDAFDYGPSSPQRAGSEPTSEDCLFLNVWTPATDDGRRPVMFYIHGGAYAHGSGSSPLYDGHCLSHRHDVVVVTVNHRLNAFGYLYLHRFGEPAFADSGNCGQLDLVLALEWLRDNIARFGGDPGRVMVFGQSGGGAKIATMMAMPAAQGLFHRAATMSGQQVTASGPLNATARARAYMDRVGIDPDDVRRLATLPTDRLIAALDVPDPILPYGSVYFGPVLDMRSLLRHPFYPDAAPQSLSIPMVLGNTHDETRAFLRGPRYEAMEWEDLPALLAPNMRVDIRPEFVVSQYRRWYPELTATELFYKATTAARSWRAAIIEAEERARRDNAGTYVYQLDWGSPVEPDMGAPHTFDVPLVFGNLAANGSITGIADDARAVSRMLGEAFVALARDGRPAAAGLPDWTPYSLAKRETMVVDLPPRMENGPRGAERRLFATVPYVQPGT